MFVEYAKDSPEDILIRITVCNRGPDPATLHLLPTIWFRNTWSWDENGERPSLKAIDVGGGIATIACESSLGARYLFCQGEPLLLFTENETNLRRIYNQPNSSPFVKDSFDRFLVHGDRQAVNPDLTGTKAAADYVLNVDSGISVSVRLHLTDIRPDPRATGPPLPSPTSTGSSILEKGRRTNSMPMSYPLRWMRTIRT